jgi:molybdopterin-guanine dinucleotide biosynthesis protein A
MNKATAIILAGGKSSRMNYNSKALLEYNGKKFIDIMLEKIVDFDEKMIVTKKENQFVYQGVKNIIDIIPDKGPLCGIYSGLLKSKNEIVAVLPCDTPFLNGDFLKHMVEVLKEYDAVIPKNGEYYQPLCAVYSKKCINVIEEALKKGIKKPIDIYKDLNIRYITIEEVEMFGRYDLIFKNINTREEYENIINKEVEK